MGLLCKRWVARGSPPTGATRGQAAERASLRGNGSSSHKPQGHPAYPLVADHLGLHALASSLLYVGELHDVGHGGVGHGSAGLCRCHTDVSARNDCNHSDRHRPLWALLPRESENYAHGTLQHRHGDPQSDPKASLLLLRLPDVPREGGGLQYSLRFSHCDAQQGRLPVHRATGPTGQLSQAFRPERGPASQRPLILTALLTNDISPSQ